MSNDDNDNVWKIINDGNEEMKWLIMKIVIKYNNDNNNDNEMIWCN